MNTNQNWHGTTIVLIRKGNQTIVAGDGQVSLGNTVLNLVKHYNGCPAIAIIVFLIFLKFKCSF